MLQQDLTRQSGENLHIRRSGEEEAPTQLQVFAPLLADGVLLVEGDFANHVQRQFLHIAKLSLSITHLIERVHVDRPTFHRLHFRLHALQQHSARIQERLSSSAPCALFDERHHLLQLAGGE